MNLFFWMLLNLGVPIIGPIFALALVAPAHGWRVAKALIAGSVKDGQLFWCAIGLFASAVYEAVTALERGKGEASVQACFVVGLCLAAFTCSNLVMSGLVSSQYERVRVRAVAAQQTVRGWRLFTHRDSSVDLLCVRRRVYPGIPTCVSEIDFSDSAAFILVFSKEALMKKTDNVADSRGKLRAFSEVVRDYRGCRYWVACSCCSP